MSQSARCDAVRYDSRQRSFALDVEPIGLVELRRDLVREVQFWLGEWERHRGEETRGRLLQSLDLLGQVVRGAS